MAFDLFRDEEEQAAEPVAQATAAFGAFREELNQEQPQSVAPQGPAFASLREDMSTPPQPSQAMQSYAKTYTPPTVQPAAQNKTTNYADYQNKVRAGAQAGDPAMMKRWTEMQAVKDQDVARANKADYQRTTTAIGEQQYVGLRNTAQTASLGLLSPLFKKMEESQLGGRVAETGAAQKVVGAVGNVLGNLLAMRGLGGSKLIGGMKTLLAKRLVTSLAMQVPQNATAVMMGDKSVPEAVRDTFLNTVINVSGIIPETYISKGWKNVVGQVGWDAIADTVSDLYATGRLTKENWKEWAVNELPNLVFSATFAGQDYADKNFSKQQDMTKLQIEGAKARIKAAISGNKGMEAPTGYPVAEPIETTKIPIDRIPDQAVWDGVERRKTAKEWAKMEAEQMASAQRAKGIEVDPDAQRQMEIEAEQRNMDELNAEAAARQQGPEEFEAQTRQPISPAPEKAVQVPAGEPAEARLPIPERAAEVKPAPIKKAGTTISEPLATRYTPEQKAELAKAQEGKIQGMAKPPETMVLSAGMQGNREYLYAMRKNAYGEQYANDRRNADLTFQELRDLQNVLSSLKRRSIETDKQIAFLAGIADKAAPAKPAEAQAKQELKTVRFGKNPQLFDVVEKLPQSDDEAANDEQFYRVKNRKTGKTEIIESAELTPVKERTAEEKAAKTEAKGKNLFQLNNRLKELGMEPSTFKSKSDKQAAIDRAEAKQGLRQGPGAATFAEDVEGGTPEFYGDKTRINQEYVNHIREQLGFQKLVSDIQPDKVSIDNVINKIKDNPFAGMEIAADINANPRPASKEDILTMGMEQVMALERLNDVKSESLSIPQNGAMRDKASYETRLALAERRLDDVQRALFVNSGSQAGAALRAYQMVVEFAGDNWNIEIMKSNKRIANKGKISDEQKSYVEKTANKLQAYKDRLQKLTAELQAKTEAGDFTTPLRRRMELDAEAKALKQKYDEAKAEWKAGLERDKMDAGEWMKTVDEYLKERKASIPEGLKKDIAARFEKAIKITDAEARDEAIMDVIADVNAYAPLSGSDWFDSYLYTNMLSNPMTHGRNIYGNALNAFVVRPTLLALQGKYKGAFKYISTALKDLLSGEPYKAAKKAYREIGQSKFSEELAGATDTGKPSTKLFSMQKQISGPRNKLAKALWNMETRTNRLLAAEDIGQGHMIEAAETMRLIDEGVAPELAHQRAKQLSDRYLYRDKLTTKPDASLDPVTKALEHIGNTLTQFQNTPGIRPAVKMAIPFVRTLVRIAQFNNQMTALGYLGAAKNRISKARYGVDFDDMVKTYLSEEAKGAKADAAKMNELKSQMLDVTETSSERRAQANLGTVIGLMGLGAAMTGNTTWAVPSDDKAKKEFFDSGRRAYSFKVGDKWIPMMYLGPLMLPFAVSSAMRDVWKDNPKYAKQGMPSKLIATLAAYPKLIADQLPLQGLSYMMNLISNKADWNAERVAGSMVKPLVPFGGMLQWINNFVDPTYRKATTIADTIKAGIPGLSMTVKAIKDSTGMDAQRPISAIWSPWIVGKVDASHEQRYQSRINALKNTNNKARKKSWLGVRMEK